jgi:hypothetical protein
MWRKWGVYYIGMKMAPLYIVSERDHGLVNLEKFEVFSFFQPHHAAQFGEDIYRRE